MIGFKGNGDFCVFLRFFLFFEGLFWIILRLWVIIFIVFCGLVINCFVIVKKLFNYFMFIII